MKVQNSYNTIAKDFSKTRKHSWPEFDIFLEEIRRLDSEINSEWQNEKINSEWKRRKIKILDVWCWNWRLLSFFEKNLENFEYTWIDLSEEMVKEAKKLHPWFEFRDENMANLPFKSESFDVIIPIASFHHLWNKKDRIKTLLEFSRILNKNWIICITNWNLFQKKYWKCFFINFWNKKAWNDTTVPFSSWWKIQTLRYYHAFIPNELRWLFKKTNFKIIKEFFIKKWELKKKWNDSFNICHILKK